MPSYNWLQHISLQHWPVHPVDSAEVRCRLHIPNHWSSQPLVRQDTNTIQHAYCGPLAAEWCTVDYMATADPTLDIRTWQESLIQVYGVPIPIVAEPYSEGVRLLEWNYQGQDSLYAQQLGPGVEPVHLYTGLIRLPEHPPELARFYGLLIRRANEAWKIAVVISSACFPGSSEEVIATNDHQRVAAMLGALELHAAPTSDVSA